MFLENIRCVGKKPEAVQEEIAKLQSAIARSLIATNPQNFNDDGSMKSGNLIWKVSNNCKKKISQFKDCCLQSAIARSLIATNPQNFNDDGSMKSGNLIWKVSNNCKKKISQFKDCCRRKSINIHLGINQLVNYIRSLGDTLIIEENNASALAKRGRSIVKSNANSNTSCAVALNTNGAQSNAQQQSSAIKSNSNGSNQAQSVITIQSFDKQNFNYSLTGEYRVKLMKRFGRSIYKYCMGYVWAHAQQKFLNTGGQFIIEYPSGY